jgi:hypothetical protein
VAIGEPKAQAPLGIDPDRMPPLAIAAERMKLVGRRQP